MKNKKLKEIFEKIKYKCTIEEKTGYTVIAPTAFEELEEEILKHYIPISEAECKCECPVCEGVGDADGQDENGMNSPTACGMCKGEGFINIQEKINEVRKNTIPLSEVEEIVNKDREMIYKGISANAFISKTEFRCHYMQDENKYKFEERK